MCRMSNSWSYSIFCNLPLLSSNHHWKPAEVRRSMPHPADIGQGMCSGQGAATTGLAPKSLPRDLRTMGSMIAGLGMDQVCAITTTGTTTKASGREV